MWVPTCNQEALCNRYPLTDESKIGVLQWNLTGYFNHTSGQVACPGEAGQHKFNGNFIDLLFHFALFGNSVFNLLVFGLCFYFYLCVFVHLFFPVVYFERGRETKREERERKNIKKLGVQGGDLGGSGGCGKHD